MVNIPDADIHVDVALARRLLVDQHPDLADLSIVEVANGWDNVMFRVGDELSLRVPRREASAQLVLHEQEWLPALAAGLPLAIPAPVRVGNPTDFYPWHWSVLPWLSGAAVGTDPFADPRAAATSLGRFLAALHRRPDQPAPTNPHRGGPLAGRDSRTRKNIAMAADQLPMPIADLAKAWTDAVDAPECDDNVLLHGDLHPLNMLATNGELSAVIDFGDITDGDPATDLMAGFYLFDAAERDVFREAANSADRPIDDAMWLRAKGWAISHMVLVLAHSADSPAMLAMAQKGLARVLQTTS